MSRSIAFFDFDGTITNKDSLAEFIRYRQGNNGFILGLVPLLPSIIAFKAGFMERQKAKEKLISKFFGGQEEPEFSRTAVQFADEIIPRILRPSAMKKIEWHKSQGHEIVVVSASPTHWLEPWCSKQGLACIATQLETSDGRITGKIRGKNCYGEEKVRRIKEIYDLALYEGIFAYGDSAGDEPMLELAHFSFYKPFR